MTPELKVLALAALLQGLHIVLFAVRANLELTTTYALSARDVPPARKMSPVTARLQRALTNHYEGLALFTIAVLVVVLGQQSTPTTQYAAYTYLVARVLYIPAYAFGLVPWRSAFWGVGFAATLVMLVAALT